MWNREAVNMLGHLSVLTQQVQIIRCKERGARWHRYRCFMLALVVSMCYFDNPQPQPV